VQRDLVERARGGDRDAFAVIATESIGRLYNIAQLMLRDGDRADDAVQETLVVAWRDLRGLRDLDGFDAWLHRILVRCVYREAGRERRRSARAVHVPEITSQPDASRAVEDRDTLDRGFRRLRPDHRAALVLHHYLGYSDDDAADALRIPAGTFKSRLHRATAALRAELAADARSGDRFAAEVCS
jgi:RNA polymerase sigma factor (sigma-70 family)